MHQQIQLVTSALHIWHVWGTAAVETLPLLVSVSLKAPL
jgi:hypothetical protein